MRRTLISALLVLAAALLVVGLTLSRSTRGPAQFRYVNGTEPKTLDPTLMTGEPEGRIAQELFEGLTRLDARSLEPVPGTAESWDVSPDGKTYTFHIRKSARWSDGRAVTARDFVYAWRRMQDPSVGSEYAYIMHMVRYAEAFNTHQDQAKALTGPVLQAVDELIAQHPSGIPQRAVRELDAKQSLHAVLKGTPSPVLRGFLTRADVGMSGADAKELRRELAAEGARRAASYAEAVRHFGVDGGVFAKDDHTLVVELNAPTPYFLELTAFYTFYPVPRWAVERASRNWFLPKTIVGNGPFRLASWQVGSRIRLERSSTYWGKEDVQLESIEALSTENLTTALNLYLTGEVEWLPHQTWPQDLGPDLKKRADFYLGPAFAVYYYRINCTRKPFSDVRVRRALNLAIDREQITRDVLAMGQRPARLFVPPDLAGYDPPESKLTYDVAQARKLLAEAGFPNGVGFPKFGILYNTLEAHKKIAEVVADQLRRNLNINVAAYNQEWQSYQESTRSMDYDLARAAWVGDYQDPNTFLDLWITNGGNNQTGWGNPIYDQLLEAAANVEAFVESPQSLLSHVKERRKLEELLKAAQGVTEAAPHLEAMTRVRAQLLAEAESILVNDELPIVPVYHYVNGGMLKPGVEGFYTQLVGADGKTRTNLKDLHPLRGVTRGRVTAPPSGAP
ncbi:MAG: peptide ABC transporter substrate-binding protein [Myxococcales bacterium]|nr:MAG: peptide ABC transporter substrate-binding protein [Myxococcales bacterium]